MNIVTAHSSHDQADQAVMDIKSQFGDFVPKLVMFFASSKYESDILSHKFSETFPEAQSFGCSTAGEIISGQMLKNSVVAMGFDASIIEDACIQVLENLDHSRNIDPAFATFERHFNTPAADLDFTKYLGIILVDGLSGSEEDLMDQIGDRTNTLFIGASAGDDLNFNETRVFANGRSHTKAAVLVLIKPKIPFDFIKTQSFTPCQTKLMVTKANEATREVLEFNNKPAAMAYAEAVGTTVAEASDKFMENPVGLMVDGEPYVRSPQKFEDSRIRFYCNVLEGMELSLLKSTDIVAETKQAIHEKKQEMGNVSAIINFNCILRTLELEQKGEAEAYGQLFSSIPTIGFSTYGEEFLGHLNQTATMIVFG